MPLGRLYDCCIWHCHARVSVPGATQLPKEAQLRPAMPSVRLSQVDMSYKRPWAMRALLGTPGATTSCAQTCWENFNSEPGDELRQIAVVASQAPRACLGMASKTSGMSQELLGATKSSQLHLVPKALEQRPILSKEYTQNRIMSLPGPTMQ